MNRLPKILRNAPLIITGIFVAGALCANAAGTRADLAGRTARVVKVLDGDTVTLSDGVHVRYIGIDAPETTVKRGTTWIESPEDFGLEAKELNRALAEGSIVRLEYDRQRYDRYQRELAYVFVDDVMINERLIAEGLALINTFPPNTRYRGCFVAAMKKARAEKKGIWASCATIAPEQAARHIGQIRTVRGRIHNAVLSPKILILTMDAAFSAVIFRDNLPLFYLNDIDPTRFLHKTVAVTGKIKKYKNICEIIVQDPEQITVCADTHEP